MSMFHVIGQVAWYAFLAVMCIGVITEFREHNERMKHRSVNIGHRRARYAKQFRGVVAQKARTPAEVPKAFKAAQTR